MDPELIHGILAGTIFFVVPRMDASISELTLMISTPQLLRRNWNGVIKLSYDLLYYSLRFTM